MAHHIHMISDSTGETVNSVMRSVLTQFEDIEVEEHTWSLVRTMGQLERVMNEVKKEPGPILYTIVNRDMQAALIKECRKMRLPCIAVLSTITRELSHYFGVEAKQNTGAQHELDEEYFKKMDAIHFTLAHDDGQETDNLDEADIVLVGASRTSKTPTCVYLSYRGINAANVPFVKGVDLPEILFTLKKPMVVGLFISPERLTQIRKSRLLSLNETKETTYVDLDSIMEEVRESRKIFTKYNWPTIDV
ncbi:MAG TPA: phosphoenolpyruvate synthase regulatory protein, partial [Alphaproteobacteria bacterium]|nr:phosphoenolpyruvate synthase regulatory protein [Alphaproteobacteria bacterium]